MKWGIHNTENKEIIQNFNALKTVIKLIAQGAHLSIFNDAIIYELPNKT